MRAGRHAWGAWGGGLGVRVGDLLHHHIGQAAAHAPSSLWPILPQSSCLALGSTAPPSWQTSPACTAAPASTPHWTARLVLLRMMAPAQMAQMAAVLSWRARGARCSMRWRRRRWPASMAPKSRTSSGAAGPAARFEHPGALLLTFSALAHLRTRLSRRFLPCACASQDCDCVPPDGPAARGAAAGGRALGQPAPAQAVSAGGRGSVGCAWTACTTMWGGIGAGGTPPVLPLGGMPQCVRLPLPRRAVPEPGAVELCSHGQRQPGPAGDCGGVR